MSIATRSVTAILTTTAPGSRNPTMATFGFPTMFRPTGLLTAMAPGPTLAPGAGLGSTLLRGVLLLSTMAAGITSVATGVGARARLRSIRIMGLPMSAGLARVLV